uniref:Uncharacterized protein n=1 Tax=Lates calcarifer TaxID=8187 RepID=A0A4W6C1N9_LATCA
MSQTEHVTFLDDDQVENAEVGVNDATTDRLALALAGPAGTVAGVTLAEQQAHTAVGQHTLLHGEALLVVASADAAYLPLISQRVSSHLSGHTLLIESTFWQPVAGNEMFKKCCTFILPNRPYDGPPRKRERISAPWSHIRQTCYRDNWLGVFF